MLNFPRAKKWKNGYRNGSSQGENDGRRRYCLCTPRDRNLDARRIRSVCKQPLSLLLGRCQSGKRLAPVSKKKKKKEEEGFLPLPSPTLPRYVSGDGKWSFVGNLISTEAVEDHRFRRVPIHFPKRPNYLTCWSVRPHHSHPISVFYFAISA